MNFSEIQKSDFDLNNVKINNQKKINKNEIEDILFLVQIQILLK